MKQDQLKLLEQWHQAKQAADEVKPVIAEEMRLRKELFASFSDLKEGTNNLDIQDGWKLKVVSKLDRKIDPAALDVVKDTLREMEVNPDLLVDWKPSLKAANYKTLTAEQRNIFDQALTITPASPTIELVPPKEK